jgi:ribosomal protein L11 methyltransferase
MTSKTSIGAATTVARLEADAQSVQSLAVALFESLADERAAVSLVDCGRGTWQIAIHFADPPDQRAVRALAAAAAGAAAGKALRFERVAGKDWVRESLAGLRPVNSGRFVVHGAHDRAAIAVNRIGVEIEASRAFGTGHHGSTRGCLVALDAICKTLRGRRAPRVLDLGTGSGVLAIAAARALRTRVLATDVDAIAVRAARANARLNGVAPLIATMRADGVTALPKRVRFDLVLANILLGPLQRFAAPLARLVAPGGRVILSGILPPQANAVIVAYRTLTLQRRVDLDGWTTLVFARRGS